MFDQLADRLKGTFDRLSGRGTLNEADVDAALREVRIALLEADVALVAAKALIARVREKCVGENVLKSIKPSEQVVKAVHDGIIETLGEGAPLNLATQPPAVILMAGLQGSGKTTSAGKIAKRLMEREGKKVMLTSVDIYRPAAIDQLATLAERIGAPFMRPTEGEQPVKIAARALKEAKTSGMDILFVDTAGRTEVDSEMMAELAAVRDIVKPIETLLVADSLTGQVATQVAQAFHDQIGVTGIVLTRVDGDGRGGAALSMREVTGQPIKFLGMGEGLDALDEFRPESIASRILGQGDVVALVEQAQASIDQDEAAELQAKMLSGKGMDLNDLRKQMNMMRKMGNLKGIMGMLPGMGKLKDKIDPSKLDDKVIIHQMAIIDSMTKKERRNPELLNAKRRIRIANGSGTSVSDVNKLVKMHTQMQKAMKMVTKMGGIENFMGKMMK